MQHVSKVKNLLLYFTEDNCTENKQYIFYQ